MELLTWYASSSARTSCRGADVDPILLPLVENAAKLLLGHDNAGTIDTKMNKRFQKELNIETLLHLFFDIQGTSGRPTWC